MLYRQGKRHMRKQLALIWITSKLYRFVVYLGIWHVPLVNSSHKKSFQFAKRKKINTIFTFYARLAPLWRSARRGAAPLQKSRRKHEQRSQRYGARAIQHSVNITLLDKKLFQASFSNKCTFWHSISAYAKCSRCTVLRKGKLINMYYQNTL